MQDVSENIPSDLQPRVEAALAWFNASADAQKQSFKVKETILILTITFVSVETATSYYAFISILWCCKCSVVTCQGQGNLMQSKIKF